MKQIKKITCIGAGYGTVWAERHAFETYNCKRIEGGDKSQHAI